MDHDFDLRLGSLEAGDDRAIIELIARTAKWLTTRGTDQWQTQWPYDSARDDRVRSGVAEELTWTVWERETLAATVSVYDKPDIQLWPGADANEAVYPCRLAVDRRYAGLGLGAELMDWVGRSAREVYQAQWIRIDVWTTNQALHDYYRRHGFRSAGRCAVPGYPAAALFQKPTADISGSTWDLFADPDPDSREYAGRHSQGRVLESAS